VDGLTPVKEVMRVAVPEAVPDKVLSRALGEALRHAREAKGWSRLYLVARLSSRIGARTLLSYEHGARHLSLLRFIELCRVLGVSAPSLLMFALQRAQIYLDTLALRVDLRALAVDDTTRFRAMILWAHNKLIQCPDGVVEIDPVAVREFATMIGCPQRDLAAYLTRFTPDLEPVANREEDRSLATV
jgi:transcriptional regulator with XRE-family HTH domain